MRDGEKPVAVKCIDHNKVAQMNLEKFLQQEFKVLNKIRHKNVCQLVGAEKSASMYYFVFELCKGGDLR